MQINGLGNSQAGNMYQTGKGMQQNELLQKEDEKKGDNSSVILTISDTARTAAQVADTESVTLAKEKRDGAEEQSISLSDIIKNLFTAIKNILKEIWNDSTVEKAEDTNAEIIDSEIMDSEETNSEEINLQKINSEKTDVEPIQTKTAEELQASDALDVWKKYHGYSDADTEQELYVGRVLRGNSQICDIYNKNGQYDKLEVSIPGRWSVKK